MRKIVLNIFACLVLSLLAAPDMITQGGSGDFDETESSTNISPEDTQEDSELLISPT